MNFIVAFFKPFSLNPAQGSFLISSDILHTGVSVLHQLPPYQRSRAWPQNYCPVRFLFTHTPILPLILCIVISASIQYDTDNAIQVDIDKFILDGLCVHQYSMCLYTLWLILLSLPDETRIPHRASVYLRPAERIPTPDTSERSLLQWKYPGDGSAR